MRLLKLLSTYMADLQTKNEHLVVQASYKVPDHIILYILDRILTSQSVKFANSILFLLLVCESKFIPVQLFVSL